jgi:hypothetical protein
VTALKFFKIDDQWMPLIRGEERIMKKRSIRATLLATAAAAALPLPLRAAQSYNTVASTPVLQGQTSGVNNPAETITFEGQGSLSKVIGSAAFSYANPSPGGGISITLDNGPGGAAVTYSNPSTSSTAYLNLASSNFTSADVETGTQQTHSALRLEWHWDGTVDGSNDLINDQIGYNQSIGPVSPQMGNNRGISTANPIYVNTNVFNTGTGMLSKNGFGLNASGGLSVYNTYSAANYDPSGNNLLGGINRVQFSFSDAPAIDYAVAGSASVNAAPGSAGYGQGNPAIPPASGNALGIGVNQARESYQPTTVANMPTTNVDPGTVSTGNPGGTAYAAGPWNSANLSNLSVVPIAANAVMMAANPGTGLSRLNKSDSQWIQTTGRLANGLMFNTVTRDADLGQRPAFALATGIDSSWAVGVNDGGDTTTTAKANVQHAIGSMKFSGKSSDTEVDYAIAQSRMGIGVLALTSTISQASTAPIRALHIDFNDMTDPQLSGGGTNDSQFVGATLTNISNGTYQAVLLGYATTVKAPNATALLAQEQADGYLPGDTNAADATNTSLVPASVQSAEWAKMSSFNVSNPGDPTATGIKGDTTGDVARFLGNILNSQGSYVSLTTSNDPADAFLNNSYLIPSLLQNIRSSSTGTFSPNPAYDPVAFTKAQLIYANKFNTDLSSSYGKVTETIGSNSYYGQAAGVVPNFNGQILMTALNSSGGLLADGTLTPYGNWMFGNFNQNGVRDLSAIESGLSAAKALYNVEPAGTTGANSAFNVSSGIANANNSTPVAYTDVNGISHSLTKGDLIVLGDYLSTGRFDGASLEALARGAAASDATGANYSNGTISGGYQNFADTVRSATLRKNTALAYMQSNTADASYSPLNASGFLRQTGAAVLTAPGVTTPAGVPRNAAALNAIDPNSGLEKFTYDPLGNNTFNAADVNADGVIDFNDALLVDQYYGNDYTNMTQQLAAVEQAPYTGATQSISLTALAQTDGQTVIGSGDLAAINANLTGAGNTNWYGYTVTKTGPGTITWSRTSGIVTVYSPAALQISGGVVHVASAVDPFTDSAAIGTDTTRSLAIAVTSGSTLEYTGASTIGIQLDRLNSLNIRSGGQVLIDPAANHADRTLLILGSLLLDSASKLDLGNNDLDIQAGNLGTVDGWVAQGYAGGAWNNPTGITSVSAAADTTHLLAVGIIQNNQSGTALFAAGHTFDGILPGAGDLLVKTTYYGDANLDGGVNSSDYSLIDNGFLTGLSGWYNGDFNYDGVINGSDYTLIDNAFNVQGGSMSAIIADQTAEPTALISDSTAVPEPASLGLLGIGVAALLGHRRRKWSSGGLPGGVEFNA